MAAKARIIKALELGFNHLRRNNLKVSAELTRTVLRKPRIHEVIIQLEDFFENFRVVHDFEDIKGAAPNPDVLASIGKKLNLLREEAGDYLVEQGMAIFRLPRWGKNNNSEQWWNINDFNDTTAVPIWSEQPHYKHHSIRLKCKERVTCLLQ